MLSEAENQRLMEVGPGTLMGEFLRRYWMPIAAVAELDDRSTKPVRLMCEDLVLFKDGNGAYGLIDRHCSHRRADLSYGIVEDCGLRCNYHGWLYDEKGNCLDQPFEETAHPGANFKDRIKIKAYEARAHGGIIWAYLGPKPTPLVPDYDFLSDSGYKQIVYADIDCNWFQCQENSIDPVHFEWLHANWSNSLKGQTERAPAHLKIGFDEFEWGFVYRRVREDTTEEDDLWTTGRTCLWPNALYSGFPEWRVPVDDSHTFSFAFFNSPVPGDELFVQERIPYWAAIVTDPNTGRWVNTHIMNQDIIAWVGQGTVADRTQEHLGESDRGVIMMRKKMLEQAEVVADGGEPKAIIRDPEQNHRLYLPRVGRSRPGGGLPGGDAPSRSGGAERQRAQVGAGNGDRPRPRTAPRNQHLAGQPQEILDEMDAIWAERLAKLEGTATG